MFGDDDALGRDEMRGVEIVEDIHVVIVAIRRVEKNEVGDQVASSEFFKAAFGVGFNYFYASANVEGFEILTHQTYAGGIMVDEEDFAGATADGFNPDCAGAGVEIDEQRIFDGRAEDVEEGFAEAVAGGADAREAWSSEAAAAIFSSDYSHDVLDVAFNNLP